MHNEFTAIFEEDNGWYIAYYPEIPGANGKGKTIVNCRQSPAYTIAPILEDRRAYSLRGVPQDAFREAVTIE